jgi:septin family protein
MSPLGVFSVLFSVLFAAAAAAGTGTRTVEELLDLAVDEVRIPLHLTVMVAGMSGLGKSTCINSLFAREVIKKEGAIMPSTTRVTEYATVINASNVYLFLTVIDTVGYGNSHDLSVSENAIRSVLVDRARRQHKNRLSGRSEGSLHRASVDLVLYFIDPHRFKEIDENFVVSLADLAPVAIVLSKADTMTDGERSELKSIVMRRLRPRMKVHHGLFDAEAGPLPPDGFLFGNGPFAVICQDREYQLEQAGIRWEVENAKHSDFPRLRESILKDHVKQLRRASDALYDSMLRRNMLAPGFLSSKMGMYTLITFFVISLIWALSQPAQTNSIRAWRTIDVLFSKGLLPPFVGSAVLAYVLHFLYLSVYSGPGIGTEDALFGGTQLYTFDDFKTLAVLGLTTGSTKDLTRLIIRAFLGDADGGMGRPRAEA